VEKGKRKEFLISEVRSDPSILGENDTWELDVNYVMKYARSVCWRGQMGMRIPSLAPTRIVVL
jgi:hypothetical protein